MMGGNAVKSDDASKGGVTMAVGCVMLALSLSFDGATGAYEDKIMQRDHVGPFELMFNIQLGKAILAFLSLVIFNEVNYFLQMVQETGPRTIGFGRHGSDGPGLHFRHDRQIWRVDVLADRAWQEDRDAGRVDNHLPASGGYAAGHRAVDGGRGHGLQLRGPGRETRSKKSRRWPRATSRRPT